MAPIDQDPLLLMRKCISAEGEILATTSADPNQTEATPLVRATHLQFARPGARASLPLDTPTRFVSNGKPVDLRSVYFAWLNREVAIPEYNAAGHKLDEELAAAGATTTTVHKFAFVERLDLITWLEGASEDSEYIQPLAGQTDGAAGGVTAATAAAASVPVSSSARSGKGTIDPRLAEIYGGERKMGDRNSVLRGIRPTDFSHVRKLASVFNPKKPSATATSIANNPALALNQKPARRPDPIIMLSPSASSLLRMSNVKTFLESGRFTPPDNSVAPQMLHLSRMLKDIDPNRPMRFVVVEGPEQFKPEYWNRVVAVFTTGQAWQFKNYRWSDPHELFKHVAGFYVGWRNTTVPPTVSAFGNRVLPFALEAYRDPGLPGADSSRWKDREVVENIWKAIEQNMRAKGWRKDSAPAAI